MATIATLTAKLTADTTAFIRNMASAEGAVTGFAAKSALVGGGLLLLGTAALVIGKQVLDMGVLYDEAMDNIATKTGATGDELDELGQSLLDVYTSIPTELLPAAEAIGQINARLDLTGAPLEEITRQLLELSRLTGTDLSTNINAVADAMLKWNVPASEIPGHIDALFRVSQATGVPLARLAQLVADNGAALQAFGFMLPETIALMAALEGSGVNTEMAMRGLRTAIGKLADEGVTDAKQGLTDLFTKIKNAPTDFDAAALAIDYFGARAGPELSAAIRSGKLDLETMLGIVQNGEGTIMATAEATNDFQEKLQILNNKLNDLLIPLGTVLVDALTAMAEQLGIVVDGVNDLQGAYEKLPDKQEKAGMGMLKVSTGLVLFSAAWDGAKIVFRLIGDAFDKLGLDTSQVGDVIEGVLMALGDAFDQAKATIGLALSDAVDYIIAAKDSAVAKFEELRSGVIDKVTTLASGLITQFTAIKDNIVRFLGEAKDNAIQKVKDMGIGIADALLNIVYAAANGGLNIGRAIVNGIKNGIYAIWDTAVGAAGALADAIMGKLKGVLKVFSPSKETEYFGKMLGAGLVRGMDRAEAIVLRASDRMANAALRPLSGLGFDGGDAQASGTNQPIIYNIYTLKSDEYQRLLQNAQQGGDFARTFGSELGLRVGAF